MVIGKKEILVYGCDSETSTIYQFYGCKWHGCACLGSASDRYQNTLRMENRIRSLGHNVVSVWECENPELTRTHLQKEFIPYLYFIVYDFKILQKPLQSMLTEHLKLTSAHVPISIMVNANLTNGPTFLEHSHPETPVQLFNEELTHQQTIISKWVWSTNPMADAGSFPKCIESAWTD